MWRTIGPARRACLAALLASLAARAGVGAGAGDADGAGAAAPFALVGVFSGAAAAVARGGGLGAVVADRGAALGEPAALRAVRGPHPLALDVAADGRVSIGARATLAQGAVARRSFDDLAEPAHAAEYLAHAQALRAFLETGLGVGVVLWHPRRLAPAPAARVQLAIAAALAREGRARPNASDEDPGAWDLLILGADAPPGRRAERRAPAEGAGAGAGTGAGAGADPDRDRPSDAAHARDRGAGAPRNASAFGARLGARRERARGAGGAAGARLLVESDSFLGAGNGSAGGGGGGGGGGRGARRALAAAAPARAPGPRVPGLSAAGLGWHGLHSYAVTRRGAEALLASAFPMNVRFGAHAAALAQLGLLRASWFGDGAVWLDSDEPARRVSCDICDLPNNYNRLLHLSTHLALGFAAAFVLVAYVARRALAALWEAAEPRLRELRDLRDPPPHHGAALGAQAQAQAEGGAGGAPAGSVSAAAAPRSWLRWALAAAAAALLAAVEKGERGADEDEAAFDFLFDEDADGASERGEPDEDEDEAAAPAADGAADAAAVAAAGAEAGAAAAAAAALGAAVVADAGSAAAPSADAVAAAEHREAEGAAGAVAALHADAAAPAPAPAAPSAAPEAASPSRPLMSLLMMPFSLLAQPPAKPKPSPPAPAHAHSQPLAISEHSAHAAHSEAAAHAALAPQALAPLFGAGEGAALGSDAQSSPEAASAASAASASPAAAPSAAPADAKDAPRPADAGDDDAEVDPLLGEEREERACAPLARLVESSPLAAWALELAASLGPHAVSALLALHRVLGWLRRRRRLRLALFAGAGYAGGLLITQAPVPAARFANMSGPGALARVELRLLAANATRGAAGNGTAAAARPRAPAGAEGAEGAEGEGAGAGAGDEFGAAEAYGGFAVHADGASAAAGGAAAVVASVARGDRPPPPDADAPLPQGAAAERDWRRFSALVTAPSSRTHHVTVCTLANRNLERLVASAAWFGDAVTVLGMDDPRFKEWGKGFGVKLELLHRHVARLPRDDVLIFTDAFDVLMMASQHEVREAFLLAARLAMARDHGAADPAGALPARVPQIVFSAEFFCHPDGNRSEHYPQSDRDYADFPFLNSGTFVGRAGAILQAMDRFANYSLEDDDQRYWTTVYLASREDATLPRIVLDHESDVFLCMNKYRVHEDLDFDPASRRYKYRGSPGLPVVIHFNGRKADVPEMFEALTQHWALYKLLVSRVLLAAAAAALLLVVPLGVRIGRALDASDGEGLPPPLRAAVACLGSGGARVESAADEAEAAAAAAAATAEAEAEEGAEEAAGGEGAAAAKAEAGVEAEAQKGEERV